jgi:two-component system NarL family sensor kinase
MAHPISAVAAGATASAAPARPDWIVVRDGSASPHVPTVPRLRTVLFQIGAAALVVLAAVAVTGALISRRSAERESVHQVAELTNVLAESVVQPALTNAMATDTAAAARLDSLVRTRVLSPTLIRVKIWSTQGRILYSDEPKLVGRTFGLDSDARAALAHPSVRADITDLDEPENRFERGHGTLLEVHRPIWTPDGQPVLFETYFRYDQVSDRAGQLWRGFAGITASSILAFVVLLTPVAWTLVARARRAHLQREQLLRRSMDASLVERRRIAATLHDGVVQELVAASFAVSGGARETAARGDAELADRLDQAGQAVRSGIAGMRSLLVDIYPPNLHSAGLAPALADVVASLRLNAELAVDDDATRVLGPERTEAVFRMAQECLRNVASHAGAHSVTVTLYGEEGDVVLEVSDDGLGFDPQIRPEGHFGLSLLDDVAREHGAELSLRTAPGAGTTWRARFST